MYGLVEEGNTTMDELYVAYSRIYNDYVSNIKGD